MKRFLMTIGLTCVFAASAVGGEIPSVPLAPPPPEDEAQITNTPSPGDVPSVGYTNETSDATLSLVQMMIGLVM
jgi:hypothetical protein